MIRFAKKPLQIIKWFTKDDNFNHEIGALGIGGMKDGELFVERLVFPKQTVNGAHVHFKPEDWAPLIKELPLEDIQKICFYWHKHPGSASASQGDEEDTFDVFMDEKAGRRYFGFLQTAEKRDGSIDWEPRIEMRKPIWASITEVEIATDEDDEIGEECKKIVEERITIGNAYASDQPGFGKTTKESTSTDEHKVVFLVEKKNGELIIKANDYFANWLIRLLEEDEQLTDRYRNYKQEDLFGGMMNFTIQPKKKQIKHLYRYFKTVAEEMFKHYDQTEPIKKLDFVDEYDEEDDIKASQNRDNPLFDRYNMRDRYWGY